ncbi:MAG: serine hydrolase [Anaerolineales bacterium]|jgi:CubicO group peptidase (beta-lactamase class C family)
MRSFVAPVTLAVLVFISGQASKLNHPRLHPSSQTSLRNELTYDDLMGADNGETTLVENHYYLPVGESSPALHALQGTLTVPRMEMEKNTSQYYTYRFFPGFSVDFFTYQEYLVPVNRTLIVEPGNWTLILSPGKVWSEPGDNGMSRASFPFTLGSPPDRPTAGGEAHNGVATFLFDEMQVSTFRFQIMQEIAPDGDIFDMWGQFPMEYAPGTIDNIESLSAQFAEELEHQVPLHPWSELESLYGQDVVNSLTDGLPVESISAAGVVIDDMVYLQPSHTRYGKYPYPRYMHHGVMSISKSIGAGISMLWLAQEYGDEVFDLKIVDYLDVSADHDGWSEVTFGDILNMATGIGDHAPSQKSFEPYTNESGANYRNWYLAETASEKLDYAFAYGNYPWGPGEILRYTSAHTFVLSAAMDAFLKSQEGPDTHLWERLTEQVFHPIGADNMTMIHVPNGDDNPGIPLMASGLRVTVDDVAKIVALLQNGGSHDGEQLLSSTKLTEALYRTSDIHGLPSGKTFEFGDQAYYMSFWSLPHRTVDGRLFQVPFMSGAGGNTIFLAPNGVTTFVFTDYGQDSYSLNCMSIAENIRPYDGDGIDPSFLFSGKVVLIPEDRQPTLVVRYMLIAWMVLTAASLGLLILDSARDRSMSVRRRWIWIIATLLLGPLGMLGYLLIYRRRRQGSNRKAQGG